MRCTSALLALVVLSLLPIRQAPAAPGPTRKARRSKPTWSKSSRAWQFSNSTTARPSKRPSLRSARKTRTSSRKQPEPTSRRRCPRSPQPRNPRPKNRRITEPESKPPTEPAKSSKTSKSTTASGGVTVEVVGISIGKTLPRDPAAEQSAFMPMIGSGQPGTRFQLSVVDPDRQIVSLDHEKSKITACTDDAGGNLIKEALGRQSGFSPFPLQVRPDRHFGLLEVSQPLTPTAGATRIHLQGEVVVECGSGEKTADQADVPLKSAGQITAGPVPFKIGPADKQAGFEFALPFKIEGGARRKPANPRRSSSLRQTSRST